MNEISSFSLDDTFHLIQLARETARMKGREDQANRLTPVVNEMRQLVTSAREPKVSHLAPPANPTTPSEFRKLLESTQAASSFGSSTAVITSLERNRLVTGMAAANMTDIDIARQLDMTREEVRLVLSVSSKMKTTPGAQS
jgi:hypothetical protein